MLLLTQWRKSRIPQYLLQLLSAMCVVIQSRVGWLLCQVHPLHAGGEVEKVGNGLSLAFSNGHDLDMRR